jgi:iron(III) transport system substrate-binding protein
MAPDIRHALIRRTALALALLLLASAAVRAAPAPLVIDGLQIADGATYDAAKREGSLMMYSTYETTSLRAIVNQFTADTGIKVETLRLTTEPMFVRVTAEFTAHRLAADWVDTSDLTLTAKLADQGVFRPYRTPSIDALEPVLHDAGGRWYSIIRGIMATAYNSAVVKPEDAPKTWNDMLDPKWKGKIGMPNIEAGGTAYSMFFFLRQRYGLAYWEKLATQNVRIEPSAAPVLTDLSRGETSVALQGVDSTMAGIGQGAPVKPVLPPEGVPAYTVSGGISVMAPHPHAAEVFMNWITSKRGSAAVAVRAYGITRDAPAPTIAGLAFPPERKLYNIRPADYQSTRATYTRDWHRLFGAN